MNAINFEAVIPRFDEALSRGLSHGIGKRDGQMCIEAAVCYALDLPHGDDPQCVSEAVRTFKIKLNDSRWSSVEARASGLRDLGIAQLGSKGVVNDKMFCEMVTKRIIQVLIPALFRDVLAKSSKCLEAANLCEHDGTYTAAAAGDKYLVMSAKLALGVLTELKSPGAACVNWRAS